MPETGEAARDTDPGPGPEAKKRKRKRKKGARSSAGRLRPEVDGRGNERPRFLLSFPRDDDLEPLIEAFEAGNYAFVREEAPRVAERAERPEVRRAALELRRRIDPDPLARYLLGASVLLLAFLVVWTYWLRGP